jgi:hypothetical protein
MMKQEIDVNGTSGPSKWLRILFPALMILISALIPLAATEVVLRLSGVRSAIIDGDMLQSEKNILLPYRLRPGYVGEYAGGHVTIDDRGNRIVPQSSPAPSDRFDGDIVVVGDSVAFGQGLDDQDTIAANLGSLVNVPQQRFGVQLIGAPGYTSWNEYEALRLADLGAARIIVLLYVNNDVTRDNDQFKLSAGAGMADVSHDLFHRMTGMLYKNSRVAFIAADAVKRLLANFKNATPIDGPANVDHDALSYSMEAIQKIKALCEMHHSHFIVAIYRDAMWYSLRNNVTDYERIISNALSNLHVENFVLHDVTEKLPKGREQLNWADPLHPSAEATPIIARQIFLELQKRGWVERGAAREH